MQSLPKGPMATFNIIPGLGNNYKIEGNFIMLQLCSGNIMKEGAFGKVYNASLTSDPSKKVIIKTSTFDLKKFSDFKLDPITVLVDGLASIETIKKNPHPNIVKYEFVGIDLESKKLFEVMEHCNGEDVWEKSDDLTLDEAWDVCYQVASALHHLHSLNITHRDVKSDNIFIQEVQNKKIFKLADFSLSCMKSNIKTNTGFINFQAPEFLISQKFSNKIDVWGLGVIFYHLIFKELPFDDEQGNILQISEKIKNGFVYPKNKAQSLKLHPKTQQLLEGMLENDPLKRFSAKNVIEMIEEIKRLESYTMLDAPIKLSNLKMGNSICLSERGAVKLNNQTYFTIDMDGNVHQINAINNKHIISQKFDAGSPNNYTSIIANKAEDCLVVSGCDSKNIYAVNPKNLETIQKWEQTHREDLNRVIFLDNKIFCAGYDDGLIKKYSVDSPKKLGKYKICEKFVCSFYAGCNPTELLVGDSSGALSSINLQSFNSKNWSIKVHQNWINSITKSESLIATGSNDNSIALLTASTPPNIIHRVQTSSEVRQLQLIAGNANLLALCFSRFVLFKINAGQLQILCQKSHQTDFENRALQSFTLLDDNNIIVGDEDGNLFTMRLLKQFL